MDVLKHYTTFKRFFGLVKQIENDPQVPKRAAAKTLTQFLTLHPHNIEQVVTIIVEHFRANVMHEIGGRAKATRGIPQVDPARADAAWRYTAFPARSRGGLVAV